MALSAIVGREFGLSGGFGRPLHSSRLLWRAVRSGLINGQSPLLVVQGAAGTRVRSKAAVKGRSFSFTPHGAIVESLHRRMNPAAG